MELKRNGQPDDSEEPLTVKEKLERFRAFRDEVKGWLSSGVEVEVNHGHPGGGGATIKMPESVEAAFERVEDL